MKCDGLPDPACVRQLNTYLTLWRGDGKEDISSVLQTTLDVLPIMASLESIIENPGISFFRHIKIENSCTVKYPCRRLFVCQHEIRKSTTYYRALGGADRAGDAVSESRGQDHREEQHFPRDEAPTTTKAQPVHLQVSLRRAKMNQYIFREMKKSNILIFIAIPCRMQRLSRFQYVHLHTYPSL